MLIRLLRHDYSYIKNITSVLKEPDSFSGIRFKASLISNQQYIPRDQFSRDFAEQLLQLFQNWHISLLY